MKTGAAAALFIILATLNSAGYRYGASDQAFYIPAILERIDPALFPRDTALIESQARLMVLDEALALAARTTGASLPVLCAILYVVTLGLLAWSAFRLASLLYRSQGPLGSMPWSGLALVAALTLRHAIARTGTNTLEGYFHPRQLAFALGIVALGLFLQRRYTAVIAALVAAALVHPTTALWFMVWAGIATFAAEPAYRRRLAMVFAGAALMGLWTIAAGPLAGHLVVMDSEWLATLTEKSYLFPREWPWWVWAMNGAYVPLIVWGYLWRHRAGLLAPREAAIVYGCLSLLLVFAAGVVLHAWPIAIAVQLQPARIFWMLDLLATIYVVWMTAEGTGVPTPKRAAAAALAILAVSTARGLYIAVTRYPERLVAQFDIRDNDWGRTMAFARTTGAGAGWLADPGHAGLYGSSVRVAGWRDVLVEATKDSAIGMYDRSIAMRTRDRLRDAGNFADLTPEHARGLAERYDLDYLVIDRDLLLPEVFRSGELRVYRLR